MADAIAPYQVEERICGDVRWVLLQARGAQPSWLTPEEAFKKGREWVLNFGSPEDHQALVMQCISWLIDPIARRAATKKLAQTAPENYASLARALLKLHGRELDSGVIVNKIAANKRLPDSAQGAPNRETIASPAKHHATAKLVA